jgi:hypothetical protein
MKVKTAEDKDAVRVQSAAERRGGVAARGARSSNIVNRCRFRKYGARSTFKLRDGVIQMGP